MLNYDATVILFYLSKYYIMFLTYKFMFLWNNIKYFKLEFYLKGYGAHCTQQSNQEFLMKTLKYFSLHYF